MAELPGFQYPFDMTPMCHIKYWGATFLATKVHAFGVLVSLPGHHLTSDVWLLINQILNILG